MPRTLSRAPTKNLLCNYRLRESRPIHLFLQYSARQVGCRTVASACQYSTSTPRTQCWERSRRCCTELSPGGESKPSSSRRRTIRRLICTSKKKFATQTYRRTSTCERAMAGAVILIPAPNICFVDRPTEFVFTLTRPGMVKLNSLMRRTVQSDYRLSQVDSPG